MPSGASLFRRQALEHYLQSQEKTVFPRLARPPVFLLLWTLLALAAFALLVAWLGQIPVYLSGPGVIVGQAALPGRQIASPVMALVFVPVAPTHTLSIRSGAPVRLQIGTQGQLYTAAVDAVEPAILSPDEIQHRYAPGSRIFSLITGPSMVVSIKLGPAFASAAYAGSLITAQIQVGSTSVLSSWWETTQGGGA